MTREELAAIRERVEAATPGPWVAYANAPHEAAEARPPSGCSVDSRAVENALLGAGRHRDRNGGFYDDSIADDVVMRADADFIAHAPTDLAALLAEVARLAAEVERLGAMVPRWVGNERMGLWNLTVGTGPPLGSVEHFNPNGPFRGWVPTRGEDGDTYVSAEADLPTACAAVCRQLGLPYIAPPENT